MMEAAEDYGERWPCYFGTMVYAGLRRAEACALRWVDVEGEGSWLRVQHGKGGYERVVPVHPRLRELIASWCAAASDPVWLFPGRYPNTPMSVATATMWTRRILDAAGLPHATGHWLRHSYATRMIELGVDVPTVQSALGHHSLGSTMVYTRSRPSRVAEAVEQLDF